MFLREVVNRSAYPEFREAAKAAFDRLVDALGDRQRAKLVRPGDLRQLAGSAWSMVLYLGDLPVKNQSSAWTGAL